MPIYDYRCRECGRVSEIFLRSWNDEPRCPHCDSESIKKLPSASYTMKIGRGGGGTTCCGSKERCETPPCSSGDVCRRS
jgi:putative FmdB family regulatory protein